MAGGECVIIEVEESARDEWRDRCLEVLQLWVNIMLELEGGRGELFVEF